MTNALSRLRSSELVRRDLRVAALPWVVSRALVLGSLWVARFLDDKLGPIRHAHAPSAGLFIYDGSWYRGIAEHGYAGLPKEGLRFFPLYPLLGRWLGVIFFDHTAAALVVLANGAALLLVALVHRLVLHETNDPRIAARAAWFTAVFPAALSLVLAYAEPLMMVGAVGMFLALRKRRWWGASALGVVAGLARPVGILLMVPAAVEAARGWRECHGRERASRLAAVLAPGVGMVAYLTWVGFVYGNPFDPFNVQSRDDLRGASVDPITHVVDSVRNMLNGDRFGAGLHLVWLVVFVALLVVMARRLPASYTAYAAATLLLAMTANNISSFDRYVFSSFPFVVGVALLTTRSDADRSAGAVAAGGLVAYSVLAFFALYVP